MNWCPDCCLWHSDTDDCTLQTKGTTMWTMLKGLWSWLCGSSVGEQTTSCNNECGVCKSFDEQQWVLCINTGGYVDLILNKLYLQLPDDNDVGLIRVVDESGEDYLYPASWFTSTIEYGPDEQEPVALPESDEEGTINERTVKWDKEQTAYLLSKYPTLNRTGRTACGKAPTPTETQKADDCPLTSPLGVLNPLNPLSPISPISVWNSDPAPIPTDNDTGSMASGVIDAVSGSSYSDSSSSYDSGSTDSGSSYSGGADFSSSGSDW